jgi:hypothetical protein
LIGCMIWLMMIKIWRQKKERKKPTGMISLMLLTSLGSPDDQSLDQWGSRDEVHWMKSASG